MVEIGDRLGGRYVVERRLGGGGMADVFLARDERLDREVALKAFRGTDTTERRRFDAETRLLAQLAHPNLVRVLDAGGWDDEPYLALELLPGPNLAQLLADGPLGYGRTEHLARGLSDALAYIHARGIVHRDLKPSNVLIDANGQARLGDFGIARFIDATHLTRTATTIGTVAYMAPEQLDAGAKVGSAADVYALGLVLLECLTGTRPFVGLPHEVAIARLARDPDIPDTIDSRWHRLLEDMTRRDPDARPSASEVGRRLGHGLDSPAEPALGTAQRTATFAHQPAVPRAASRRNRVRHRLLLAGGGIAVTAVAVALVFGGGTNEAPTSSSTRSAPPVTFAPTTQPATTQPATTKPATTRPPSTIQAALSCAELDARRKAVGARQREIDRKSQDSTTRKTAKDQLAGEKHALAHQKRTCAK